MTKEEQIKELGHIIMSGQASWVMKVGRLGQPTVMLTPIATKEIAEEIYRQGYRK